jgi:hypothetical protein
MAIYLVERDLPGLSRAQFHAAHRATIEAALRSTADGLTVRYLPGGVCAIRGPRRVLV